MIWTTTNKDEDEAEHNDDYAIQWLLTLIYPGTTQPAQPSLPHAAYETI